MSEIKNNISIDYGNLLLTDSSNYKNLTESKINTALKQNYINFSKGLFEILKNQIGEEDENRDYDKEKDEIQLPKKILNLPRSLPIPKPKPMTKWEKYKKEKGITQRKRSRMVYSEIAKDWVPRWGKGSIKKIENETNWALEEKQFGVNPFEQKNQEKKLLVQKQKIREMKNKIRNSNENNFNSISKNKKNNKGKNISLDENNEIKKSNNKISRKEKKKLKAEKEIKRLEQDKKNLGRRLEQIQKSTRSMGRYDKKLKNEKELNMIKKKRVDKDILQSRKKEKSRDKMIMDGILNSKK